VQQNGLAYYLSDDPVLGDLAGIVALPSWAQIVELMPDPREPGGFSAVVGRVHRAWEDGGHPWFGFDNQTDHCSRFGLIFDVGGGTPDPHLEVAANLARIQRVIRAWRSAKSSCFGIAVLSDGVVWDYGVRSWNQFDALGLTWDQSQATIYAAE
jgi:hypothetical protein